MLQRERGEYRASSRTIEQLTAKYPESSALELVRANNLARIGLTDSAARVYETFGHASGDFDPRSPYYPLRGDDARGFAWHHALEADVLASAGDTARSRILADSIELVSARSYYGRDTRLPHDIRGVIALRAHRFNDAVQELQKGRWGTSGWTTTLAHLARAYLALNRPADAIATVREAYQEPPDAMGRYEPRSELDLLMAESFLRAGELDSATVYADYVRSAWRNADPEPRARLAEFEKLVSVTDADGRRPTALSHEPVSLPHATP
jgi:predicted Zn-dependent protease